MNPGEMTRRVTFQTRGLDDNGDPLGDWQDAVTRSAKIMPLKGGEGVQQQRLAGRQPVVIVVYRDPDTRAIDNAYRAFDTEEPATIWNVSSVMRNEADDTMEILAVQNINGSNA